MYPSYNDKAYFKLAQLENVVKEICDIKIIERLLEKEGDIDYAITDNASVKTLKSYFIGYTALHIAAYWDHIHLFMYLLNHGADFTKKNQDGRTVLHILAIHHGDYKKIIDNVLVNSVLSAHVDTNNFSNPCNKHGRSHFHIACMTNNLRAVEFFLNNGIAIDESDSTDPNILSGCTPLHFAAMCMNTKVVEILLAYGADMHITDRNGKTPLHVLIERKIEIIDSMMNIVVHYEGNSHKKLQQQIQENDKIINMLLENSSSDNDYLDEIGLSNFHVACILQDASVAQDLADQVTDINHSVNKDSGLWPGYTALHFASHISISTVEMLIRKGANPELKDSNLITPLDICMERYKIENICSIMTLNAKWEKLLFSDDETKLVSLITALTDINRFKKFVKNFIKDINMRIPMESSLWPGYTPLHVAVHFAERPKLMPGERDQCRKKVDIQIIRFCLSQGADLSVQDSRGRTALHLAFRLKKMTVVDTFFRHCREIPNVSDEDNLTHLHIACAARKTKLKLKKCVLNNLVINTVYNGTSPVNSVRPGWTPLHVYITGFDRYDFPKSSKSNVITTLLKHGADCSIKDAYGLTPIHWLMNYSSSSMSNKLLNKVKNDCVAEEYGLSYLHIACTENNYAAAKHFLDNGADVNLAIKYNPQSNGNALSFLSSYDKCTPLHLSQLYSSTNICKLLVKRGADVFVRAVNCTVPLCSSLLFKICMMKPLGNDELQNRIRREFGWTKVHLACQLEHIDGFQGIVEAELVDINTQISSNSPFWKGYTPLHILATRLTRNPDNVDETIHYMIRILLENGADVTIMDDEQNTPLSIIFTDYADNKAHELAALLMKYHKNFDVNPVNSNGISHFHRACLLNDVDAVRGFLSHGVNVNHPIDYLSGWRPGHTPLHLATKLQVVELLLSHGADIHIEDVSGCNVLHEAVKSSHFDENVIKKIIESGAEINIPNFRGRTPFETAITDGVMTIEKLKFFIKQGFFVNSCNPITGVGYISIMLKPNYKHKNSQRLIVEMMMKERSTNIFGRTTLHHLMARSSLYSDDYVVLFEKLIKCGHDIDEQDNEGKTALRLAVEFQNMYAIDGLLACGADINVPDINNLSVLSYIKSTDKPFGSEYEKLTINAIRLVLFQLYIDPNNRNDVLNARQYIFDRAITPDFPDQIALSREIELGVRSLRLYDFLSETGAVSTYPSLTQSERCRVDEYFENLENDNRVKDIRSCLKLQYRKAVKRVDLCFTAMKSLRLLLGFNLPDLCAENVLQHLRNTDLKNIIQAEIETECVQMDVD